MSDQGTNIYEHQPINYKLWMIKIVLSQSSKIILASICKTELLIGTRKNYAVHILMPIRGKPSYIYTQITEH